jgi:hypothetical protein
LFHKDAPKTVTALDPRLKKLQNAINAAVAGLSAEQLSRHPPGKWSASEVLEHLHLTYTGTIKGFQRVLAAGQPSDATPSWVHRSRKWLVLGLGYLPSGREAPTHTRPRGNPPEKVLAEIGAKISEMDAVIAECEAKFRQRKLLEHPMLGPLNASEWKKFHLLHGMHHVKQIRRLRDRR